MGTQHHLASGEKLAGHYEIIQVLNEDDFEILYLVKDTHLADEKFVLKELFLSAYTSREEGNRVSVPAKAKQSFEQTKQDIKEEVEKLKSEPRNNAPKYYGYFEENDTLYTIMEFVNSADTSPYLAATTEEVTKEVFQEEITPKEVKQKTIKTKEIPKEKPKSRFFLKVLIVSLLIFVGLLYYSYNMIQEDKAQAQKRATQALNPVESKTVIKHPPLADKRVKSEAEPLQTKELEMEKELKTQNAEENLSLPLSAGVNRTIPEGASYIDEENLSQLTAEVIEEPTTTTPNDLSHLPIAETFPMEAVPTPTPSLPSVIQAPVPPKPQIIEAPRPQEQNFNNALGTKIN